jgi:hypothetical protein
LEGGGEGDARKGGGDALWVESGGVEREEEKREEREGILKRRGQERMGQ